MEHTFFLLFLLFLLAAAFFTNAHAATENGLEIGVRSFNFTITE